MSGLIVIQRYSEGLCQTMDRIGVVTRQDEDRPGTWQVGDTPLFL